MQCKSNGHRDVGTGYFEHIWLESCMAQVVDLPAEPLHLSMLDQNTTQTKEMSCSISCSVLKKPAPRARTFVDHCQVVDLPSEPLHLLTKNAT